MNVLHPTSSQKVTFMDTTTTRASLVLQLIPSVHAQKYGRHDESVQLASAMQGLVIDKKHPVALEMTGTGQERRLLLRAKTPEGLAHAETQLRARLPQVTFLPCTERDDPFRLRPDETVSVTELHPGRASYLPLHSFDAQHTVMEDPVLGLLGALDALPADIRAIAQIALEPADPTWSDAYQRKAVEHALEPERQKDRQKMVLARVSSGAPSGGLLLLGGIVLAGLLLLHARPQRVPHWGYALGAQVLHGQWHQVWMGPHRLTLLGGVGVLLLLLCGVAWLQRVFVQMRKAPLYDMRSVAEKTSRNAYRVRIRCYVIGPAGGQYWRLFPALRGMRYWRPLPWRLFLSTGWMFLRHREVKRCGIWLFHSLIVAIAFLWHGTHVVYEWSIDTSRSCWQQMQQVQHERARREHYLARLIAAYRQYHQANGNFFRTRRVNTRRARRWIEHKTWWRGIHRAEHLIDVKSLAALWHLPADESVVNLAQVTYQRHQTRLLPLSLRTAQGNADTIGHSVHAGHSHAFGFPEDCLQSHMLIGGKSGEGKSTLMVHVAVRTMDHQNGLVLIDPHGDLAEDVLCLVPASRLDDTLFIDLSDENFAWGINPLDATMSKGRDKVIADLIKILSHIWASSWGPRMEIAFEYALRTLYEANKILCQQGEEKKQQQYTLLDVMALLTDESFCHSLLESIKDPFITRWWASYYDPLSIQMQRDRIDPVLSKVAKFESSIARHIIGQSLTTLDLTACVKEGKIVLVKLAKGMIGEDVARILGATIFGLLQIALEEQGNVPLQQRQHVPIFLDEFQTLEGVDWGVLAELRKYGATFFLATQSLEYLRTKQILPVVISNVKQFAIFRMSSEDAKFLSQELAVEPDDIVHLESLSCYLKLMYHQQQQATFSLQLSFPPTGNVEHAKQIRQRCQQRYMHATTDIDQALFEHLARQIAAIALPSPPSVSNEQKPGFARQDGGNRGRKGRQSAHPQYAPKEKETRVSPLHWNETVGPVPHLQEADEQDTCQEVDPHENG